MDPWRTRIALLATLATGCTGEITAPGTGSGPNGAGATGSGATGTGTGATGTGTGATGTGTGATGTGGTGTGGVGTNPDVCVPGVPATSQMPRLTKVQYDNTIRDLVGLEGNPSSMLAPDTTGSVNQRAWDGYKSAADAVATQVMGNPTARARAIPCTPSGDGAACAQQMIAEFGRRAFRRPLTPEETTRFTAMYTNRATVTMGGTFDEAAQLIIRSFLLSPSFLTRAEIGTAAAGNYIALTPYEIATRLSYLLWSSTPDDALLDAAEADQLGTPELILAQAQRMIADPRAHGMVSAFHDALLSNSTHWIVFKDGSVNRDAAVYPSFTADMANSMLEETTRFVDHVVFGMNGTFKDLMTAPVGFVNAALAPLYGLPAASYGADLVQVSLDPAQRPGLLTRAGFLTAFGLANRPSPILRGAFIQKHVLCTTIGAPDMDVLETPLPLDQPTNRERTDAQTSATACAGCHSLINSTGYALESYDAVGAWQTNEKDTGAAINTAATVTMGATEVNVAGASDLMTAIANSPEAQRCYAQGWVSFAYERTPNSADACTVQTMATKLTAGGYTVLNLVADLTQSESFRVRVQEP